METASTEGEGATREHPVLSRACQEAWQSPPSPAPAGQPGASSEGTPNARFLLSFSLPNFHFHAVTAYDIGKRDDEGRLRTRADRQG